MSTRATEIEEYTNRWFLHPISRRLARLLAKTPVHPNAVSFTGMTFGFLAAISYYHYDQGLFPLWGFLFMLVWHVLDGTDGQLARLTNKATVAGKVIDGFADYSVFLSVYLAFTFALVQQGIHEVAWLMPLAAASHIVQAAAFERQRETYLFWVYSGQAGKEPGKGAIPDFSILKLLYIGYLAVQNFIDPAERVKQKGYDLHIGPHRRDLAAKRYREKYWSLIHVWSLLSANTHTVAIFVFAWFGKPLYYFIFEVTVLNPLLICLLVIKRQKDERFMNWLAGLEKKRAKK